MAQQHTNCILKHCPGIAYTHTFSDNTKTYVCKKCRTQFLTDQLCEENAEALAFKQLLKAEVLYEHPRLSPTLNPPAFVKYNNYHPKSTPDLYLSMDGVMLMGNYLIFKTSIA